MELVKKVIGSELTIFERKFAESVKGSNPLLDRIMRFIIRRKGKQMRPMFVFLSAKIAAGINESTFRAASLIELLHTATLVHDDVVDNAMIRRNFFSINALWKNKIAVLVGDYLLSKGLLLSLQNDDYQILQITSRAVKEMSEGELLQMEKARKLDIKEDVYFDIIRAKTASLLSAACSAGAYSATDNKETAEYFRQFGENIGIAFQIMDDLFDYGAEAIGKPTGIDIKEKKMTLPLIYALQNADNHTKRRIIYIIKNQNTDREKVQEVISYVQQSGGIDYATKKMKEYQEKALQMLDKYPDSDAKAAMKELVNYVIARKY
ncbi:polyprenyl synthetase family protein [Polluticoccus soli]|uniref:polyprenyl synthetase family protein n=1 Tax=Polluticoccus soli TaxID=3034150 RepID=UPI0023E18EF4|nr:polyprenyl synthetase family protein [Flavipsychrobacter sp. JY13-12]